MPELVGKPGPAHLSQALPQFRIGDQLGEGPRQFRHILRRHENGLEKCVGCSLCAAACPAHCIRVIAAENTPDHQVSEGERYAAVYEINMLRCIFCGFCVEACPTEALGMSGEYELATYTREAQLYGKERLLEPLPAHLEKQ